MNPRPQSGQPARPRQLESPSAQNPILALTAGIGLGAAMGLLDGFFPAGGWEPTLLHALGGVVVSAAVWTLLRRRSRQREESRRSKGLLDLAHAINAVSADQDYSVRALCRSTDDIALLVDTVNHMFIRAQANQRQLIERAERAEAGAKSKGRFLAMMSHELRTPIHGILGMADLLEDTSPTPEQSELTDTLRISAEGLLHLVNDVLDFSKGEAGRLQLEQIPFSVQSLISTCIQTVAPLAQDKEIELVPEIDPDVPDQLRGDPTRLRQILLNLLGNAIKFTPEGTVSLRVDRAAPEGSTEAHGRVSLRFEVQDSGIGIPEERLGRLFQSYSQVDASDYRVFGGTGLGLMICKQLVETMGGSIFVRSEEGIGSTFGFALSLPLCKTAEELEGQRILVVAKDEELVESLRRELGAFRVETCSSGLAGRQTLLSGEADSIDLLVLDSDSAEGFGLQAEGLDLPAIPMILMSSLEQLGSGPRLRWAAPIAHLPHPIVHNDLMRCVRELLGADHRSPTDRRSGERRELTGRATISSGQRSEPAGLRAALPASSSRSDSARTPGDCKPTRVLVAEDHPVNRRLARGLLDRLGIESVIVENGEDALGAYRTGSFDLILMDMRMPVMDGTEATRRIRALEAQGTGRIPIVSMTASLESEELEAFKEAGCDAHLPKPMTLAQLDDCIAEWVAHKTAA